MATTPRSTVTVIVNKKARKYINRLKKAAKKLPDKSRRTKWHRVEDDYFPPIITDIEIRASGFYDAQGHFQVAGASVTHWRELPKYKPERDT